MSTGPLSVIQINHQNAIYSGGVEEVRRMISDHLLSLSLEDRYLRFFHAARDESIVSMVNRIDFNADGIFVVFDESGQKILAFLHAAKCDANLLTEYEFGLSVNEVLRGNGIGYDLFKKAADWAKSLGCKRIFVNCLYKNKSMQKIAEQFAMETKSIDYETKEGELTFSGVPNIFTYFYHHAQNNILICDLACRRKLHELAETLSDKSADR